MTSSSQPSRYRRLADELRDRIDSGRLQAGDRLPSEAELSLEHGVSRGTVVRAISELVSQGLVNRRQGSGSYVASRSLHRRAGHLLSFSEFARSGGRNCCQKLLEFRSASAAEARQLGVNEPAMLLRRLRCLDDQPCSVQASFIPLSVCRRVAALQDLDVREWVMPPDFSLYRHFAAADLAVHEARERLTARLADNEENELLATKAPHAVIAVARLGYAEDGELLEAMEAVYRADIYSFDSHLLREPDGASLSSEPVAFDSDSAR